MMAQSSDALGTISELCWPFERAEEALESLARRAGFSPRDTRAPSKLCVSLSSGEAQARSIEAAGERLGVGVQAVSEIHSGIAHFVRRFSPELLVVGS